MPSPRTQLCERNEIQDSSLHAGGAVGPRTCGTIWDADSKRTGDGMLAITMTSLWRPRARRRSKPADSAADDRGISFEVYEQADELPR